MSADRVVYSFVLAWIALIAALVVLDWLGNPNRGSFRPKGDTNFRDRDARKADRERQRLDDDALVRSTLRDAYGASSLRLGWSGDDEDLVRQLDDTLILDDLPDHVVDADSRVIATSEPDNATSEPDRTDPAGPDPAGPDPTSSDTDAHDLSPVGDDSDPDEQPEDAGPASNGSGDTEPGPQPTALPGGWRLGDDPLALTAKGTPPAPATVRSRVWKNLATDTAWSTDNQERMQRGLPPIRTNPVTGDIERAGVDVETGQPSWGDDPLDPFDADT